ncbi:MAG TPA: GspE/PulE family protein [Syntrophales bacterium]|jgi:type II secretory ATPase GspE/PulE/Tfp pilus assembly ATPase PilB-like protein/putative methionine-R-sulfoxide reductase with GAF domain|nr:GspE/PulE family protein [Syntrophales bacterium]HRT61188.1 GspE/PulE family protein [Syntrophales bacterium]
MFPEKTEKTSGGFDFREISLLSEKLALRKSLLEITNRIHAAQNIREILVDLKDGILALFNAYMISIFVVDRPKNELFTYFLAGSQLKEIRVPIGNTSIAGFAAANGKPVNIADAYDKEELKAIHKSLTFDESWDKKSGYRTTQVLAVPVYHENNLMGVVQLVNKKGGGKFNAEDQSFLEEIAEVLGIAFYNQQKATAPRRRTRFDYLVQRDLIKPQDLENLWTEARKSSDTVEGILLSKYKISREDIGRSLEDFYRCRFVQFNSKQPIPDDLLRELKRDYLRRELWVPLERTDGKIRVVVDDPNNIIKRDIIQNLLKTKSIEYCVALREDIIKYINHFYQIQEDSGSSIQDILSGLGPVEEVADEEEEAVSESDSAIMQLVNKIINDAQSRRASDIHIEPNYAKKNVEIRYRIDGHCSLFQTVPYSYRAAIVSRIKIMSNLDITERRLPQDGKIKFKRPGGQEIELRVATLPTQGNMEDVVLRILAKGEIMRLEDMALSTYNFDNMVNILSKPYGLILCVGPTGSGKTTTLHAALHRINTPDLKIWTIEDPVEITQNGIRQVQVNPKIGLDFARAMRAFLRADPDVIMVGEMRDFETAKIGIEASLTGHLVLSTLHTNSAPETIVRLLDMGIDPLNFADSLLGILAQRLARTICNNCKESYHPTKEQYDELVDAYGPEHFAKLNYPYNDDFKLYRGKGCGECDNTGYRGRTAIHELLVATDNIKRLIQKHDTVEVIREIAIADGMTTLLQDGILKVLQGQTDFEQVRRVCIK